MVRKHRSSGRWWSRFHFLVRFLGLTGLVAVGAGLALGFVQDLLVWDRLVDSLYLRAALKGATGNLAEQIAVTLLVGGAAAAALALLLELLVGLVSITGRRSALGFNVVLQSAIAAALLVGVNLWSFQHYQRFDWTRSRQFTLPEPVKVQLAQLSSPTTIVVYQLHKTFGQLSDKPDAYDYAAERKVVEKVKDLVEEFRELGPKFRVVTLDVEEKGYRDKLDQLTKESPELRDAIDQATENSIFFLAPDTGRVQRLSFNDFYRLDKTASREANGGRGNLVLLYQGVEPFARKVLNLDEKRPKIGILVVHELLTTEGAEDSLSLQGLKKSLTSRGFDLKDIILKKWSEFTPPTPAVLTFDENKYEEIEERLADLDAGIGTLEQEVKQVGDILEFFQKATLDDLNKRFEKELPKGRKLREEDRRLNIARFEQTLAILKLQLDQDREERSALLKQKAGFNVDKLAEERRMADLKAKLERLTADCDVLFIPRMTLRNVTINDRIPNRAHHLDRVQVEAIRDFLKAGKPVLAAFGPTNEPADRPEFSAGDDELEPLLEKLGIRFGKDTVLFNVETKSFAERRTGLILGGGIVDVPPLEFDWQPGTLKAPGALTTADGPPKKPNPIREAMKIAAHSLGASLDLKARHPRPIYFDPQRAEALPYEPEFLITSAASWNDDQPFPTRQRTPRYEAPKPDDPKKGTLDEKRRGPFPVGVAAEVALPAEWYGDKEASRPTVRIAVLGHGGLLAGGELSPAKEELAVNTLNWLLGRDDLLPRADRVWSYPRLTLPDKELTLWEWYGWLAPPALFLYLGLVVLLARRVR